MGFEAEYYSETEEFRRLKNDNEDNSMLGKKGYWRKKDRTLIKISDMTVNHILNCLDMFDAALVRHINNCMSQNIECEIPEDWAKKILELEEELKIKNSK